MDISGNIKKIKSEIPSYVKLVVVSKTQPAEKILEAYNSDYRFFAENRVQELSAKYEQLPKDIEWHLIGHLQTNKVKEIVAFVSLIHSVDSFKLLTEINKCAANRNRIIDCLLQIHIAKEETKFGFNFKEAEQLLRSSEIRSLKNICITGLMGMASFTEDKTQIRNEFKSLKSFFTQQQALNPSLQILSMGMSSDYQIAIEVGSTLIRVGSAIFGSRH